MNMLVEHRIFYNEECSKKQKYKLYDLLLLLMSFIIKLISKIIF